MSVDLNGILLRDTNEGCVVTLKVLPRSSVNKIVGVENGELKVKVRALPVEGAANEAVLLFLAVLLKRPKGLVVLVKGHKSRHKTFQIAGVKAADVLTALKNNVKGE